MPETYRKSNFRDLVIRKMSIDAVPSGGGMADALNFLRSEERIVSTARSAEEWAIEAIRMVREAPGQNPWRNADDETIAGEILRRVKEKEESHKRRGQGA